MKDPKCDHLPHTIETKWGNHVTEQRENGEAEGILASLAAFHHVVGEERRANEEDHKKFAPQISVTRAANGLLHTELPQQDPDREMNEKYKAKQKQLRQIVTMFDKFMNTLTTADFGNESLLRTASELKPMLSGLAARTDILSSEMCRAAHNLTQALDTLTTTPNVFNQVKSRVAPSQHQEMIQIQNYKSHAVQREISEDASSRWRRELHSLGPTNKNIIQL
jgi:hypothetical protein